jgi:hypothetical protein
MKQEGG